MSELKPCPFCEKEIAEIADCKRLEECANFEECPADEPYVCVVCSMDKGGCGTSSGYYDSDEKAVAAWNRRAQPDNEPLTLDELRGMGGKPVYCVDSRCNGAWALVHPEEEVCTDANYGDWEFYCYGWTDGKNLSEDGWLAYDHPPKEAQ